MGGVGYCQSMNYLAAMGLLFCAEEDAFWLLSAVIEKILPSKWLAADLLGTTIDLQVLVKLTTEHLPEVRQHLSLVEIPLELIATPWLMTLFSTSLPAETLFRLVRFSIAVFRLFCHSFAPDLGYIMTSQWDSLFVAGSRVLLCACLALLSLLSDQVLACIDFGDVSSCLSKVRGLHDPDAFISATTSWMEKLAARRCGRGHCRCAGSAADSQ